MSIFTNGLNGLCIR